MILVEQVDHLFGKTFALKNLSLSLEEGLFITLVGPDGAGKTTLLRLIAGLLLPSKGSIKVGGFDTKTDLKKLHEIIGYMPQKFGLYEDLTVLQNLHLYADLQGVAPSALGLEKMGLGSFTNRLAGNLSGGMKQKLGLACTLLKKPRLLLLDEPSVGVDPLSRKELWDLMEECRKEKTTVLWSTSYLDEAEKGDLTLLLHEGHLLYQGKPSDFTEKVAGKAFLIDPDPKSKREQLSQLMQIPGVIDGTVQGDRIRLLAKGQKGQNDPSWVPAASRFEDAFIERLGGGVKERSKLAKRIEPISTNEQEVIVAKDLTKRFGTFTAIDHISFTVKAKEVFGLLGPNGAGKSTTFKILSGLLKATSGEALISGISLQNSEARSMIGYMAQKFSLYGHLSVLQNLEFFAGIYPLKNHSKQKAIDEMIDIFGLTPFLSEDAASLPLGYKQRLALSCACMHRPKVLFLDEPTSGVDPITRREFWNHINGLVEKGCTILVSTHFMDEAEYCDRIALIHQSQLLHVDTPDRLKELANKPSLEEAFMSLIERYDATKKT